MRGGVAAPAVIDCPIINGTVTQRRSDTTKCGNGCPIVNGTTNPAAESATICTSGHPGGGNCCPILRGTHTFGSTCCPIQYGTSTPPCANAVATTTPAQPRFLLRLESGPACGPVVVLTLFKYGREGVTIETRIGDGPLTTFSPIVTTPTRDTRPLLTPGQPGMS